jgi:hypothetical protein
MIDVCFTPPKLLPENCKTDEAKTEKEHDRQCMKRAKV